jgi:hypothetical protein
VGIELRRLTRRPRGSGTGGTVTDGTAHGPADDVRRRVRAPGICLDCGAKQSVRHVGIVFVHGIGSQQAGETLLDWGGAMIRVLLDARVRHKTSADPVIDVQLEPGPGESRFIEVQLPRLAADETEIPEQHWVMTEAWWAQRIKPPGFGQMAQWLGTGGAIRRIVDGLVGRRHGSSDPRLRAWAEVHPLHRTANGIEERDGSPAPGPRRGRNAALAVVAAGGNLYLQTVSALLLVVYGFLRSVEKLLPIGPLKDGALTRPLDSFVLDWFGDVYVLLSDSAQSASVRSRLVDSLEDLAAAGCQEIVIVAHSGGAIVSYMTLADAGRGPGGSRPLKVDRLVTLGEGLNLAWHLIDGQRPDGVRQGAIQYERLYQSILEIRPDLEWDDFWASQDPAPVGVLDFRESAAPDEADLSRVRSHATWNRLSFSEDHGGYWDNDEEFLIPVLRLLEGRTSGPNLFGDEAADATRSNLRRRRLSLLSLLRQACFVAPMAGIVAAFAVASKTVFDLGDAVATAWNAIPGTGLVSGGLDYVRGLRPEDTPSIRFLAEAGVWVVAAAIAGSTAFSLLAPPERPIPWPRGGIITGSMRLFLRAAPYLVGIPVVVLVIYGAARFLSGATLSGIDVGDKLLVGGTAVVILGVGLSALAGGRPARANGWRYAVFVFLMVAFMVLACGLVAAPVVAAVVFPDVGRVVVGSLAIVAAFQGVARIGTWRWSVWDARERSAARTGSPYRGTGRVISQVGLIALAVAAAFVAVVLDSLPAAAVAAATLAVLVLAGVAIDVLDAVREERESPTDSLRRRRIGA